MGGIAKGIGNAVGSVGRGIGGIFGGATDTLFGNNIPNELKNPRLTSFGAPGLSATYLSPENLQLERGAGINESLSGISDAFMGASNQLGNLKPLVEPGFGRLTEAGVRAVRDARRASMGDLRENLRRRRVLGSRFGADDIARTNAEFAKKENEFRSQAFLQEMDMLKGLINDQSINAAKSFLSNLEQSNFETGIAAQMASGVTSVLSNNAQIIGGMSNRAGDAMLNTLGGLGSFAAARKWPIPTA